MMKEKIIVKMLLITMEIILYNILKINLERR